MIEHQQVLSDFGIPQGSILGPMIFNLYVADLEDNINHRAFCFQCADDTTIYKHCKFSAIKYCEARMNTTLKQLTEWSNVSNLALTQQKLNVWSSLLNSFPRPTLYPHIKPILW